MLFRSEALQDVDIFHKESACAKAPARQPSPCSIYLYSYSLRTGLLACRAVALPKRAKAGGGGGSRTRVRNRCQPGESMLCPVRLVSLATLKNGQDAPRTSPIDLASAARTEPLQPAYCAT